MYSNQGTTPCIEKTNMTLEKLFTLHRRAKASVVQEDYKLPNAIFGAVIGLLSRDVIGGVVVVLATDDTTGNLPNQVRYDVVKINIVGTTEVVSIPLPLLSAQAVAWLSKKWEVVENPPYYPDETGKKEVEEKKLSAEDNTILWKEFTQTLMGQLENPWNVPSDVLRLGFYQGDSPAPTLTREVWDRVVEKFEKMIPPKSK